MNVVDEVVDPGAACVLVHAHTPKGNDFALGVAIEGGEVTNVVGRDTREFFNFCRCVIFEEFFVGF